MNVDELKVRQGNVEIIGTVVEKQDVREWEKFGKNGKVCNCILKDDSGAVSLNQRKVLLRKMNWIFLMRILRKLTQMKKNIEDD